MESGNKLPHSKLKEVGAKPRPIVRFHTAESPFTVERDLRVKIATKRKSPHPNPLPKGEGTKVRPGDELEVTVTTTDPQGKPVAAELSLAMVEQSLLERFASPLPSIGDFFRGGQRQPAVRCTSSITFSYRPATQPINPRLLAEKDREEIAKEEEESRRAAIAVTRTAADGTVLSLTTPELWCKRTIAINLASVLRHGLRAMADWRNSLTSITGSSRNSVLRRPRLSPSRPRSSRRTRWLRRSW